MAALQFSAEELFIVAEQIEKNGAAFYRKAARANADAASMLNDLASMEDEHYRTFAELHRRIGERAKELLAADPDNEVVMFAQAFANENVFDVRNNPALLLKGDESLQKVFTIAIGIEKESVVFYTGMKEMVPLNAGRDKVELILKEEMKHIALLSNKLKALAAS